MLQTPLHEFHLEHGARMVDFAGWDMPILYRSILDEHRQVRTAGGLFDVSHMGRLKLTGPGARRLLERTLTRRVSDMDHGRCRYSLVCNDAAGVLDDVIVYRFDTHWMLVVNASNRLKIVAHLQSQIGDLKVQVEDVTQRTAMVAIQGPKVMPALQRFSDEAAGLKRYAFCTQTLLGTELIISRTGYTGEDGVEVILPAMSLATVMNALKDATQEDRTLLTPIGLGARDTLRMEAAMPLYGHELGEDVDPLSAGLAFAVDLSKGQDERTEPFIGQTVLARYAAEGSPRQLIGLRLEGRRTARQGMKVLRSDASIGAVTSGCLSPTLGYPIAMALVQRGQVALGDAVQVELGEGKGLLPGQVVPLPFYKR